MSTSDIIRDIYLAELSRTAAEIKILDLQMAEDEERVLALQQRLAQDRARLIEVEREQLAAKKGLAVLDGVSV